MLSKKRDKGATSLNVMQKVEKRLEKKFDNSARQFGQRSQHMQFRDHADRLIMVNFSRALQEKPQKEKRSLMQKV